MNELLKLKNINFSYSGGKSNNRNFFFLKDISFSANEKDFISVIGKNGSGKSTIIKIISRIFKDYRGEVCFRGKNTLEYQSRDFAKFVSYIPQTAGLTDNDMTLREMLLAGRYASKKFTEFINTKEDEEIVSYCMNESGIYKFKDSLLSRLSGGERQKAMLTLGLVQLNILQNLSGKLLIIDEPLTYLDVNYQIEIFSILKKLNELGLTIMIVIHDLNLALNYTGKTLLMNEGRLVLFSETKNVITEQMLREHFLIESKILQYENKFLINYSA